ncbi:hypothetical protein COS31_03425 [Candidatus Roizmanbacteria bacterium CG02_land_8_20_14_3_00_36_15]|uniref:Uncharacterized protein n=2 Tax=Candidatus Roizmaniibacteriota TaxID=1752723 RepID=A0A2H0BY07_9BACT|nr:MAG: hypothetical protein COW98_03295 [Candidatus Roizmanbacteria bacterium CG22_combo_CG10-13_8_21_14_all_35_9]PIV09330.1 MAG: hypothetical protein COS51_03370 [Candidatus Roizmanbacteria bacterium CG03_land_8_20_14_0_80_36_21]PIV37727.1 MAG: hypothetical protein COS31_03425 [Candidatus Roizmanbacteria bacterium CG02_land_8_20_14_3_00_36_15]PIY70618.1 MAG: hypothetical protein COY89_00225 [Candidatus Roizmanbacteria bacterium CG_4_10_14_0_8_um_filter_36_36]PJA53557.1 MAG: hypothetical prote
MSAPIFLSTAVIVEIILLFWVSHLTLNELFYFLRIFLKNDQVIYAIVSVFFLPGTIVHEMGHFVAATVMMLRVYSVNIFPQWEKNQIKLGSVIYEKKDIVRSILVGIAPIFFAFFFFWFLARFKMFPGQNFWLNILFGYIVFTVSSTMFSSKKDLVDLAFIIPLIIVIIGLIYIFDIRVDLIFKNKLFIERLVNFFKDINFYLLFSLAINILLIFIFKSFRFLLKK